MKVRGAQNQIDHFVYLRENQTWVGADRNSRLKYFNQREQDERLIEKLNEEEEKYFENRMSVITHAV